MRGGLSGEGRRERKPSPLSGCWGPRGRAEGPSARLLLLDVSLGRVPSVARCQLSEGGGVLLEKAWGWGGRDKEGAGE